MGEVVAQDELILRRAEWKRNGLRVVFAAGAFDLLHPGHVRLLEQARSLGDILVVGIQSDAGVRATKRDAARPVMPANERAEILASMVVVNYVVEFDGPSPAALIARLAPDIVVEGAEPAASAGAAQAHGHEHTVDAIRSDAEAAALAAGAKIVRIPLEPGYSTGRLLGRIKGESAQGNEEPPNA